MKQKSFTFKSGLRLVYQKAENTRPMSLRIYALVGSKDEEKEENGISHFIEHLVFKGTKKRTNRQISADFEFIGANFNAFTSIERTCFYLKGLNEKFEESLEILSDVVFHPLFRQEDIDKERNVVYEEIAMYNDKSSAIVSREFKRLFYGDSSLGREVIGSKETLSNINRKEIVEYYKKHYIAKNIVVSVVCGLEFDEVKNLVEKYVDSNFEGEGTPDKAIKSCVVVHGKKFTAIKKSVKQANALLGFPCCNLFSRDKFASLLLAFIFGGGMSSRLFTRVREDEGLVYEIYADADCAPYGGCFVISFAANENNAKKTMKCIKEEIVKLKENGVTQEELDRAKNYSKSMLLTGHEKVSSISRKNFSNIVYYDKFIPINSTLKKIENVTIEKINEAIDSIFNFSNMCGCIISKSLEPSVFEEFL